MAPTVGMVGGTAGLGCVPTGRQLWVMGHKVVEFGGWVWPSAALAPSSKAVTAKAQNRVMPNPPFGRRV
jgi:hypothetical protein